MRCGLSAHLDMVNPELVEASFWSWDVNEPAAPASNAVTLLNGAGRVAARAPAGVTHEYHRAACKKHGATGMYDGDWQLSAVESQYFNIVCPPGFAFEPVTSGRAAFLIQGLKNQSSDQGMLHV